MHCNLRQKICRKLHYNIQILINMSPLLSLSPSLVCDGVVHVHSWDNRPWFFSLTAAVQLPMNWSRVLNCVRAAVNVYVYQSTAVCLCYMVLWTTATLKHARRIQRGRFMTCWIQELELCVGVCTVCERERGCLFSMKKTSMFILHLPTVDVDLLSYTGCRWEFMFSWIDLNDQVLYWNWSM